MPRHLVFWITVLSAALVGPTCNGKSYVPVLDALRCPLMPDDSYWHADVSELPVHPRSDAWVRSIGIDAPVHPDFGSTPSFGGLSGTPIGIPYVVVGYDQPFVPVEFDFASESDPGPSRPNGGGEARGYGRDPEHPGRGDHAAAEQAGAGWRREELARLANGPPLARIIQ